MYAAVAWRQADPYIAANPYQHLFALSFFDELDAALLSLETRFRLSAHSDSSVLFSLRGAEAPAGVGIGTQLRSWACAI